MVESLVVVQHYCNDLYIKTDQGLHVRGYKVVEGMSAVEVYSILC